MRWLFERWFTPDDCLRTIDGIIYTDYFIIYIVAVFVLIPNSIPDWIVRLVTIMRTHHYVFAILITPYESGLITMRHKNTWKTFQKLKINVQN